jgi:hypothetical protein
MTNKLAKYIFAKNVKVKSFEAELSIRKAEQHPSYLAPQYALHPPAPSKHRKLAQFANMSRCAIPSLS